MVSLNCPSKPGGAGKRGSREVECTLHNYVEVELARVQHRRVHFEKICLKRSGNRDTQRARELRMQVRTDLGFERVELGSDRSDFQHGPTMGFADLKHRENVLRHVKVL